jgi:type I restriction enzyme S subunit
MNTTNNKILSSLNSENPDSDNVPRLRFLEFTGEWERKKLGEVGEIVTGKTPSTTNLNLWNGEIQFVTPTDINESKYQFQTQRTIKELSKTRLLPAKSIMFTCIASIGKMSLSINPCVTNQQINSIIPSNYFNNEFIYYALLNIVDYIKSTQSTNTLPIINKTEFSKFEVNIPKDKKEQIKIAAFLTAVDEKIQALKKKKSLLKQYKKGVMQKLFSQTLRFKDENRKEFAEWEVKKLGEVGKFYAGGDLDKLDYNKIQDEKYCYPIYANGAGEGIYGYATTFQYNSNCVTVSGRGNLGYANTRTQKFNAIVRLIVIEPKEFINPKFLEEIINQTRFSIESTGVPQLTVPQISSYKISIPSLAEQTKIANFLSVIDEKINHITTQIEKTQVWKNGLLQQMFV